MPTRGGRLRRCRVHMLMVMIRIDVPNTRTVDTSSTMNKLYQSPIRRIGPCSGGGGGSRFFNSKLTHPVPALPAMYRYRWWIVSIAELDYGCFFACVLNVATAKVSIPTFHLTHVPGGQGSRSEAPAGPR